MTQERYLQSELAMSRERAGHAEVGAPQRRGLKSQKPKADQGLICEEQKKRQTLAVEHEAE